jgi:hypothetical protein
MASTQITAFGLFCAQNHMTIKELKEECTAGKWLPMLIMQADDNSPIIPIFDTVDIAVRFAKKNLPKEWVCGIVDIKLRDAKWMDEKGWKAIKFTYPRKLKDIVKFNVEILEYDQEHKLIMNM